MLLFFYSCSAKYDQFHDFNAPSLAPPSAISVDPFQTVDPFASQSDIGSPTTLTNSDWFQSSNNGPPINDPFFAKNEISPKNKKSALKKNSTIDPWDGSTTNTNGNGWAQFTSPTSNGNSSVIEYRALYDYKPERDDEMGMTVGDVIIVSLFERNFC